MRVRRGVLTRATSRIHVSRNGHGAHAVRLGVTLAPAPALWLPVFSLIVLLVTAVMAQQTTMAMAIGLAIAVTLVLSMREAGRIAGAISEAFYRNLNSQDGAR